MSACRIATAAAVFNFQPMQNCRTQNVNEAIRIVNQSLQCEVRKICSNCLSIRTCWQITSENCTLRRR